METSTQVAIAVACVVAVFVIFALAFITFRCIMSPSAQRRYFFRNGGAPQETMPGV